ncbi:MAG: hypothetical protein CBC42_03230 [Betaproteobacteria bacterium TMED82]|nr:MAG: hypothetical protein CBC42_03230 [Betaproteobacteria bacterium TMED82]|tara:strand:+ start:34833 stop:36578 length:1746 start_codon:yes stop_codon:yes gene_type:complete
MNLKGRGLVKRSTLSDLEIWKNTSWRSKLVLVSFLLAFFTVVVRVFYLQFINAEHWQKRAEIRYTEYIEIPAPRGKIFDRNGEILASSIMEYKIGIVPKRFDLTSDKVHDLASYVDISPEIIKRKTGKTNGYFYLHRGINEVTANQIKKLKIEGVEFERIYKRHYPFGRAFSTLLGCTNDKDLGIEGIERAFEQELRGKFGSKLLFVEKDNRPYDEKILKAPLPGQNVHLTVDSALQTLVHKEASVAREAHKASAVSIVVVDSRTGDILAMVNSPAFDPRKRRNLSLDEVRNRSITDKFEPGSTFKPFAIAAALDQGLVTAASKIETAPGYLKIGEKSLRDVKSFGMLTLPEVLAKSSNVGTVRVALQMEPSIMYEYYNSLGFGKIPDLPFGGLVRGKLPPWQSWGKINQATISYGYGVSVSLVQLARAYTVFARNGVLLPLRISKSQSKEKSIKVFSPTVVSDVRFMLEKASSKSGTGYRAAVKGFQVAGKTGTSKKQEKGSYSQNRYIASYVGFAPSDNPRLIVAIMVDEPKGTKHGGQVAAPIFSKIVTSALRRLQMSPDPDERVFPKTAQYSEERQQ